MAVPLHSTINGIASLISVFLVLTSLSTGLRFIARRKQRANFGIDDFLMLPAQLSFIGMSVLAILGMAWHFIGTPVASEAAYNSLHPTMLKVYTSNNVLQVVLLSCAKLSALFFFRRIFCVGQSERGIFDIATNTMIAITCCWFVTFLPMTVLVCGATDAGSLFGYRNVCSHNIKNQYYVAICTTDFAMDILIMALPIPKIWSLHAPIGRKLSICTVFLVAAASAAVSCARLVIDIQITELGAAENSLDPNYANTEGFYYQILECGLAIFGVNLPSLWYFHANLLPERILRRVRSLVSSRSTSLKQPLGYKKGPVDTIDPHAFSAESVSDGVSSKREALEP